MAEVAHKPPERDWRWYLSVLTAGISGPPTALSATRLLERSLGSWGAFAVGILSAAVVIAVVARLVSWMLARDWRDPLAEGVALGVASSLAMPILGLNSGYWRFAVPIVILGVGAALWRVVSWMIRPRDGDSTTS